MLQLTGFLWLCLQDHVRHGFQGNPMSDPKNYICKVRITTFLVRNSDSKNCVQTLVYLANVRADVYASEFFHLA